MKLPNFLLADNTEHPEQLFIIHTQYPRFAWDVMHDEVEWFDELEDGPEDELVNEIAQLMETANAFYEREIRAHEREEEEEAAL